ncbi:hypothetical protein ASG87_18565 [Frateuria sp. Soil773]|nr:hypothetical protein ASG87_18565 [Frateuria sp. Soil773]
MDFVSRGAMPLALTRTYNYFWNGIGLFGRRWLSDYDFKLLLTTDDPSSPCYTRPGNTTCDPSGKPIWAQRPDGRRIKFNYATSPAPGWYEDKPSPIAKILKSGSNYVLYSEDHTVETYDASGFPVTVKNRQNIGWTFQYGTGHYLSRVTHSSGRHVDFTWSNGLLTQVTDPAGNAYQYSYKTLSVTASNSLRAGQVSAANVDARLMMLPPIDPGRDDPPPTPPSSTNTSMVALLTDAVQPGSAPTHTTYLYEDSRYQTALTGKTINGVRYSWFTYDDHGRVTETKHANGVERYQFAYELDAGGNVHKTTITNPLTKVTTYTFDADGNQVMVEGVQSTNCPSTIKASHYDANGYLDSAADFRGNITTYDFDAKGQLQQTVENAGATDASQQRTISYAWDTDNRKTRETVVGDHEIRYAYGTDGRLASVSVQNLSSKVAASQGQTRTTTYAYTTWPNGLLASMVIDGPLAGTGDAITVTYSQTGDVLTVKNSLGQTTTSEGHNDLGQPRFVTGPNGDKSGYLYDARGRVIDMQTYRDGTTQHTYYEYDGFGRLSKVTRPDGQYHAYQYDVAGRLVSEYEPEAGGTFEQKVYTYNAMSLPTSVTTQRVFREPQRGTVP